MRRRDFLKIVIGGTTVSLWSEPILFNKLVPFLMPQNQLVPGVATWYATSCRECPAGCGMIIKNREGRAIKAEGNPLHPINSGTLCARGQASVQAQYDPDRVTDITDRRHPGRRVEWSGALAEIGAALGSLKGSGRVAVISDLQTGSMEALIRHWLKAFGSDRYLIYEPFDYEPLREANRLVFGTDAIPDYRLDECDLIISFAADFLETWISPVKFIRRFAERRVPRNGSMSKFVYVGPRVSMTAFNADEYILVAPGDERWVALLMLQMMGKHALPDGLTPERVSQMIGVPLERISKLSQMFSSARTPVALAGSPAHAGKAAVETAVAANVLNAAARTTAVDFGRVHALGTTARFFDIHSFISEVGSGQVEALIILGANPAYSLSPDYRFGEALKQVRTVISLTCVSDETSSLASWVLPINTPLESWGDYEPETGILNLMQPVMGTRHNTRHAGDVLIAMAKAAEVSLESAYAPANFEQFLRNRAGFFGAGDTQATDTEDESPRQAFQIGGAWGERQGPRPLPSARGVEIAVPPRDEAPPRLWAYPSAMLFDGRGANKRWLQEMPDVVNHAVWGSWIEMHPKTASKLNVAANQVIELSAPSGKLRAPVFLYQGMASDTVAVQFGQGHVGFGQYASQRGANPFHLLSAPASGTASFPVVEITGRFGTEKVVTTDGSVEQHGRGIVSALLLSRLPQHKPEPMDWPLPKGFTPERDLYPPHEHVGHRWAMVVDLSRCVGCEACMAACYAENNLAVVGKKWMEQGREMEWIWIDRYYDWSSPTTPALMWPMLCQQCDAAPCEPVCPVFAASHTEDGLNAQVYNRCIGTRYCNNNCPYKARRFNWRNYDWPGELQWQLNPDVTVRSRGVMEKCTFCVQRIRDIEARAKKEQRPIKDGEIMPACAQTCPANVFVFGDLMDPKSKVSQITQSGPRRYQVLQELNTKPAVFYLKKVINDSEPA
jgi:molybdopterin-containing oxidoreductase family iron-sulfur binding subunit